MNIRKPFLTVLNTDQILHIHNASLKILARTGIKVESPKARKLLVSNGCIEGPENRVYIPEAVIKSSLNSVAHVCDNG